MIPRSLRVLLEGLIDYSGFAPPAGLPVAEMVRNYAGYLHGNHRWLLGRSILPLTKMAEYEAAFSACDGRGVSDPWRISALTTGKASDDVAAVAGFNARHADRAVVDMIELKADTPDAIRALRPTIPTKLKAYVEIPLSGDLASLTAALAANGLRAKIRTGGLTPDAIPSCEQVARFIIACRAARIPFKFTAGMHAPLRSVRALTYADDSPRTMMHGFINAFLAAAIAWQGADQGTILAVLEETAAEVFHFDDERALWRDTRVACEFLEAVRRNFAISLGSCSFTEPVEGLQQLQWI